MLDLFRRIGFAPRRCTWEITLACNLRCAHCGSRAGRARADELTTAEALVVADDLAELGCRHVTLAGGEPTLRRDWPTIAGRLRERGVRASIITNGLTWSSAHLSEAKAVGLHRVGLSVDGLGPTHDRVRGVAGAFPRVLEAIDGCVAAGFSVVVVTHVTRHDLGEIEALHAVLAEHGVSTWQVQLGVPQGNMEADREAIVGPEDVLDLIPRLAALNVAGRAPRVVAADNVGYYGEHEQVLRQAGKSRIDFWVGCRAGIDVLGIESHGDVKGCLSLPSELNGTRELVEGNVRERRLAEIWNDPNAFAYTRQFTVEKLRGACAGCEWGEVCRGGCTWTSFAHHGHPHEFPHCFHALTKAKGASTREG